MDNMGNVDGANDASVCEYVGVWICRTVGVTRWSQKRRKKRSPSHHHPPVEDLAPLNCPVGSFL